MKQNKTPAAAIADGKTDKQQKGESAEAEAVYKPLAIRASKTFTVEITLDEFGRMALGLACERMREDPATALERMARSELGKWRERLSSEYDFSALLSQLEYAGDSPEGPMLSRVPVFFA